MAFQESFIKNPFVLSKDTQCVIVLFKITTVPHIYYSHRSQYNKDLI